MTDYRERARRFNDGLRWGAHSQEEQDELLAAEFDEVAREAIEDYENDGLRRAVETLDPKAQLLQSMRDGLTACEVDSDDFAMLYQTIIGIMERQREREREAEEEAQAEAVSIAQEFKWWRDRQKIMAGGHCPACGRFNTGLWYGRVTCPHCRWCETD